MTIRTKNQLKKLYKRAAKQLLLGHTHCCCDALFMAAQRCSVNSALLQEAGYIFLSQFFKPLGFSRNMPWWPVYYQVWDLDPDTPAFKRSIEPRVQALLLAAELVTDSNIHS